MSPTLITIGLALVTGLCVVAYQTPKIYKKLFNPLFVLCLLVQVGLGGWASGYSYALSSLSSLLPVETIKTLEKNGLPEGSSFMAIGLLIIVFFLDWLAGEVIDTEKTKNQNR